MRPTGLGLRPVAKAPDEPPNPTGYAPPLDSTPSPAHEMCAGPGVALSAMDSLAQAPCASGVPGGERSTAQFLSLVTSRPDRSSSVTNSSCRGCPKTTL